MCQIIFCEKNNPPKSVLEYANERNSHGFGFAWSEENGVRWSKGYDGTNDTEFQFAIAEFLAKPFPKAIHFRLATHGGIRPELTHPFPIKRGNTLNLQGEAKMVLFHNGVWNKWDDYLREGILGGTLNPNILREHMSDSRAMAILCQRFGPDFLDVMNLGINKVLVLMPDTYYRYGDWKLMDGWSASNSSIEKPTVREFKGTHGIHVVGPGSMVLAGSRNELPVIRKNTYLDSTREDVEQALLEWSYNE